MLLLLHVYVSVFPMFLVLPLRNEVNHRNNNFIINNRAFHVSKCLYQLSNLTPKIVFYICQQTGLEKLSNMLATQLTAEVESSFEPLRASLFYIL